MRQHLRAAQRPAKLQPLALAAAMLMAAQAPAQAQSFAQEGTNSTSGNPSGLPFVGDPASLNFGSDNIFIANGAAGSFSALAGAVLQAGGLSVGIGGPGVGTFTATGTSPGAALPTRVLIGGANGGNGAIQVGRSGNGVAESSFSLLAGASATATFLNVGRDGAKGAVFVGGAGSQLLLSGQGTYAAGGLGSAVASVGWAGTGRVEVSDGALWRVTDGGTDSSANNRGPGINVGIANGAVGGNGSLSITGAARVELASTSKLPPIGAADNGNPYVNIGRESGSTGSVSISAGGKLLLTGEALSTPAFGRTTFLGVGGYSDTAAGGIGTLSVTGPGSQVRLTGTDAFVTVGRSGTGTLTLADRALLEAGIVNVGRSSGSNGTLTMDASTMTLNGQFTDSSGSGAGMSVGNRGGTGKMTMSNASVVTITNLGTAGAGFNLGGTPLNPLGTGRLEMSGASRIDISAAPTLASASFGRDGKGDAVLQGNSQIDIGDGSVHVGRLPTGNGTVELRSGSKMLAGSVNIGGTSDTDAGGIGSVLVTGLGSELRASGPVAFIGVGRGGTGTLTVGDDGKVASTAMSIGRNGATGGNGKLFVDNATIDLSGQQTAGNLVGANLAIGVGGATGEAKISGVSTVNITNYTAVDNAGANLVIGGSSRYPLGTGKLELSGGSQINVLASPGVAGAATLGAVTVGNNGTGRAELSGGSSINVGGGSVYVARQVGPADLSGFSGTLILNSSTINAGFVGVGVGSAGVGNALGAPGGIGKLVLNDSTINTSRFELGVGSELTGNNGVISAGTDGPVVIGGTISPGNSPGRLRVKCDITMLAGSKLILEINDKDGGPGVDFDIDELIIGDDSKFDLTSMQIIFSFIGSTNPNEFAASEGGFSLDRFLLASGPDDQILGGLSTLFGNKRNPDTLNWGQAVNSQLFAFESSVYDVSEVSFDTETGQIDVTATARVPEPASFALVLLALAAMTLARRRQAALPR